MRDLFGRIQLPPARMTRLQRIDTLRGLAGRLQADERADVRWLGAGLAAWLQGAGPLDEVLQVRAERGSHTTPQAVVRRDAADTALLALSEAVGSDAKAIRAMRGELPCAGLVADLVAQLRSLNAPASKAAFSRARERVSRHSC